MDKQLIDTILQPHQFDEASLLLAASFIDSPSYADIFSEVINPIDKMKHLAFLFLCNINIVHRKCPSALHCTIEQSSGKVVAFYLLQSNHLSELTLYEKITGGLLWVPFLVGFQCMLKIVQVDDAFTAKEKLLMGDRSHFMLNRVAVAPHLQGTGIGSKMLTIGIQEADDAGLPIALSTQKLRNVEFYSRLGFKVVSEWKYSSSGIDSEAYNTWFMVREPIVKNTAQEKM